MNGFTRLVDTVLQNAGELATQSGHTELGTEHLLFGLISVEECLASQILKKYGVDKASYLQLFDESVQKSPSLEQSEIDLTPLVKEILRASQEISARLNQTFVGTEHVMLALLATSRSAGVSMLERGFNVNIDSLKIEVLNALRNEVTDENGTNTGDDESNSVAVERRVPPHQVGAEVGLLVDAGE